MPDIKYVKGTDNVVADALSRRCDLAAIRVLSVSSDTLGDIREGTSKDPDAQRLLLQGTLVDLGGFYYIADTNKLFVPDVCRASCLSVIAPLLQATLVLTKCMS